MLHLYRHHASGYNAHADLSWQDRDAYETLLREDAHAHGSSPMDVDNAPYNAAPGKEGHDISHEGGEHEGFGNIQVLLSELGYGTKCIPLFPILTFSSSMTTAR